MKFTIIILRLVHNLLYVTCLDVCAVSAHDEGSEDWWGVELASGEDKSSMIFQFEIDLINVSGLWILVWKWMCAS